MTNEIDVIIFSKDRACQVEACTSSFYRFFTESEKANVSILYKASTKDFDDGYEKAKKLLSSHSNIQWVRETSFYNQTAVLIEQITSPITMFLVDDIIFVNSFSLCDKEVQLLNNNALLATSLRLHPGIKMCYATNEQTPIPNFTKGCVWNWQQSQGDWSYPMSVDGNLYRTQLIKNLVSFVKFSNPNTFEAALDQVKFSCNLPQYMSCYMEGPRLINIPANRVQNTYQNRFAKGYSATELNKLFLSGKRICTEEYAGLRPETVHVPIELKLVSDAE